MSQGRAARPTPRPTPRPRRHRRPGRPSRPSRPSRISASDLYAYIVMGALALLELYSLLSAPARSAGAFAVAASPAWAIAPPVESTLVLLALTLAALAAAYAAMRRLGPTLVSRAQLQWRLPLPLSRRALLTPGFALSLGVALGLAALIATLLAVTLLSLTTPLAIALTITAAVALTATVYSLASAAQRSSNDWWRADALVRAIPPVVLLALIAGALLGAWLAAAAHTWPWLAALADAAAALAPLPLAPLPPAPLPPAPIASATIAVGVLAVAAIALTIYAYRRLDQLSTHRLRRAAAAFDELRSAALSMESTDFALAPRARMAHADRVGAGRWSRRYRNHSLHQSGLGRRRISITLARTLAQLPFETAASGLLRAALDQRGWGELAQLVDTALPRPRTQLVLAQVRVWLRTPGHLAAILTVALLPTALIAAPILNLRWILVIALFVCGLRAVSIAGRSAKLLADNRAIGRLFPVSAAGERRLLSILPALILLAWTLLTFGLLTAVGAAPSGWMWLAAPVGLGLAGSSVRSAFRPPPDWTAPAIATEAGLIPTGWVTSALHGRMLTAAVLAPAIVALALGAPVSLPPLAAQLGVSTIAWFIGTSTRSAGDYLSMPGWTPRTWRPRP